MAQPRMLDEGVIINVVTAPLFIATKIEAFFDRGEKDFYGSRDLEDVITVVDGRSTTVEEIAKSAPSLRAYLSGRFSELLGETDFIDCLSGHLPPDSAGQARLPQLMEMLRRIAV